MNTVLILTGTCGSGKTTISTLLANSLGWKRISEDDIWQMLFGKNRGPFGSVEHRNKRGQVHGKVFAETLRTLESNQRVVIDATVHESPPEAYKEYQAFFEDHNIQWKLLVLQPRLEVAISRDSTRNDWIAGPERIRQLRIKFTGKVFGPGCFLDNSDETPNETLNRIITLGAA